MYQYFNKCINISFDSDSFIEQLKGLFTLPFIAVLRLHRLQAWQLLSAGFRVFCMKNNGFTVFDLFHWLHVLQDCVLQNLEVMS